VPVERAAEGPAAEEHGVGLLFALGMGRHHRAHPPRALRRGARAGHRPARPRPPDRPPHHRPGWWWSPHAYPWTRTGGC
jgi:hypothetical protein